MGKPRIYFKGGLWRCERFVDYGRGLGGFRIGHSTDMRVAYEWAMK